MDENVINNNENNKVKNEPLFSLEVPSVEKVKEEVKNELAIKEEDKSKITTQSDDAVSKIMAVDINSIENRKQITNIINDFGIEDLKKSKTKNAMLKKRLGSFDGTVELSNTTNVTKGLGDLTRTMKDLDPSGLDFAKHGLIGKIVNPVRRYFDRYKTADQEIGTIVEILEKGKKSLQTDNTSLELEEVALREMTVKMAKNIEMGMQLDTGLSAAIEQARLDNVDPDKIRFVEEEVLFPLRQRIQDFQQVALVSQQGVIAMELIRRNNNELIRSVDRAENVSVNALTTGVTCYMALYNQKLVLEKVNALNNATNQMLEGTAQMLRTQGVEIQKQSVEPAIAIDTLKNAFSETLGALNDISAYKQEALPQIKATIDAFQQMAIEGETEIAKMEKTYTDINLLPEKKEDKE